MYLVLNIRKAQNVEKKTKINRGVGNPAQNGQQDKKHSRISCRSDRRLSNIKTEGTRELGLPKKRQK